VELDSSIVRTLYCLSFYPPLTPPLPAGTQALSILLPVLILLLSPTSTPLPPSHTIAISHLLVIASLHSANFKEATVALNEEEKKVLEVSIRASVGGGAAREEQTKEAPRISLKMFG
jgi:hypothetical protein